MTTEAKLGLPKEDVVAGLQKLVNDISDGVYGDNLSIIFCVKDAYAPKGCLFEGGKTTDNVCSAEAIKFRILSRELAYSDSLAGVPV